jgi:protein gp37
MNRTNIEWADATWNPVTGCTPISPGCENCYARRMAHRLRGRYGYPTDEPFRVTVHQDRLLEPLARRRPRRVFVCSMGDLFHADVPSHTIDEILAVAFLCPHQTFMVLTKRLRRMADHLNDRSAAGKIQVAAAMLAGQIKTAGVGRDEARERIATWFLDHPLDWPLRNVWLGATMEDQATAQERMDNLLATPAALRFISYEPALGPLDWVRPAAEYFRRRGASCGWPAKLAGDRERGIGWVIAGGETGPGARPAYPRWFRSVRDQCVGAGVPFFFKGWGEWSRAEYGHRRAMVDPNGWRSDVCARCVYGSDHPEALMLWRVGRRRAGRILDGLTWNGFPSDTDAERS